MNNTLTFIHCRLSFRRDGEVGATSTGDDSGSSGGQPSSSLLLSVPSLDCSQGLSSSSELSSSGSSLDASSSLVGAAS